RDEDGITMAGMVDAADGGIGFEDSGLGAVQLEYTTPLALTKVLVDGVKPTITAVSISSNNADSSWAKVGDEVTLRFSVSEYTDQLEVQIAGMPVTASRGGKGEALKWTAVYQLTGEEENGEVTFSITGYEDEAGNAASSVNTTTDGSSVTFDKS